MCNAGGDYQGSPFMGGSGVWIPLQGKIGGFERNQVGVQTIDVDLKVVEVSHRNKEILTTARSRVVQNPRRLE
jgi:hypothetical protein